VASQCFWLFSRKYLLNRLIWRRAGGGVWILDRHHKSYWGLDHQFRVVSDTAKLELITREKSSNFTRSMACVDSRRANFRKGFSIASTDPVSIEALPDGSILILDRLAVTSPADPNGPVSQLLRYRFGISGVTSAGAYGQVEVVVEGAGKLRQRLNVVAYDIAYADGLLYAVESEGNQTFAFKLDAAAMAHAPQDKHRFPADVLLGSRALVARQERFLRCGRRRRDQ